MDEAQQQIQDLKAAGPTNKSRRRNRRRERNQIMATQQGDAQDPGGGTALHSPQVHHTKSASRVQENQSLSPSVQKLFDSVNLEVTFTKPGFHDVKSVACSAEPTPPNNLDGKRNMSQPVHYPASNLQAEGSFEQSWPTLGDSSHTKSQRSETRFDQKMTKRKKGKAKQKDHTISPSNENPDQVAVENVSQKMKNVSLSQESVGSPKEVLHTKKGSHSVSGSGSITPNAPMQKPDPASQSAKEIQTQSKHGTKAKFKQDNKVKSEKSKTVEIEQQTTPKPDKKAGAHMDRQPETAVPSLSDKPIETPSTPATGHAVEESKSSDKPSADVSAVPSENVSAASSDNVSAASSEKKSVPSSPQTSFAHYLTAYKDKVGPKFLQELDIDFIRPLSKKSSRFPEAHFYCRLCEYHMDSPELVEEHRKNEDGHIRRKRVKSGDALLKNIPAPTSSHLQALSSYLDDTYEYVTLPTSEIASRKAVVDILEKHLQEHSTQLRSLRLQICGSVKAGFALKGSNTNVRIITPKTSNLALVMTKIHEALVSLGSPYTDIEKKFESKEPSITVTVEGLTGKLFMQFLEESYYISNMLLSCYSRWHPRLKKLAVLFKHLAKVGQISDADQGALAPYCFPIMVIFYCQQHDLAPVFFENADMEAKTEAEFQGDIDELSFKKSKKFSDYLEQKSIGELWLNLLKYYSLQFRQDVHCVSIMSRRPVMKASKAWGSKRLAIEDPAIPKRNLCKTVCHARVFEFINDVIRQSYKYFGVPQLITGPAFTKLTLSDSQAMKRNMVQSADVGKPTVSTSDKQKLTETQPTESGDANSRHLLTPSQEEEFMGDRADDPLCPAGTADEVKEEITANSPVANSADENSNQADGTTTSSGQIESATTSLPDLDVSVDFPSDVVYDKEAIAMLKAENIQFDFYSKHLALTDLKLPIFCRLCSKANHKAEDCPEEQLPPCVPLPPPSKEHREALSNLLKEIKEQTELCPEHVQARNEFMKELTHCIQRSYPDAQLCLYGSSGNGFGSAGSDLDICMTLAGTKTLDASQTKRVIMTMANALTKIEHLKDIIPLAQAKVPIIKFSSAKYQLDADLSLYNVLAQRNTRLLLRYSQIDPRVRPLGYCTKEFAKNCDIGDASKGSLSSYAYVLLLIYYLQQCDPPVLPVLQELYEGDEMPETLVEGWNTWYYDGDNSQLAKVWPGFGKNSLDIAQLWIGFLDFYAQKFDYKSTVVSIRCAKKMSKFEKLWNSDVLAIEDPFDLKRNLGSALSKKMNAYILTTFIKARSVFYTSPETLQEFPEGQRPSLYKFYFHHKDLPSGGGVKAPAPNNTCRICGKIGHYAKMCPTANQNKDRQKRLRELRQQAKKNQELKNEDRERRLSENEHSRRNVVRNSPNKVPQQHYRGSPGQRTYNHNGAASRVRGHQPNHVRQLGNGTYNYVDNMLLNQNNNAQGQLAFPVGNAVQHNIMPPNYHVMQQPNQPIMAVPLVAPQVVPVHNLQTLHQPPPPGVQRRHPN